MFRTLKEEFGLKAAAGSGALNAELGRTSAVGLAVGRADPLGWGRQLTSWGRRAELGRGEVRQEWGWSLISSTVEVRGWLAILGRLILWLFHLPLFLVLVPKVQQEVILTS